MNQYELIELVERYHNWTRFPVAAIERVQPPYLKGDTPTKEEIHILGIAGATELDRFRGIREIGMGTEIVLVQREIANWWRNNRSKHPPFAMEFNRGVLVLAPKPHPTPEG